MLIPTPTLYALSFFVLSLNASNLIDQGLNLQNNSDDFDTFNLAGEIVSFISDSSTKVVASEAEAEKIVKAFLNTEFYHQHDIQAFAGRNKKDYSYVKQFLLGTNKRLNDMQKTHQSVLTILSTATDLFCFNPDIDLEKLRELTAFHFRMLSAVNNSKNLKLRHWHNIPMKYSFQFLTKNSI